MFPKEKEKKTLKSTVLTLGEQLSFRSSGSLEASGEVDLSPILSLSNIGTPTKTLVNFIKNRKFSSILNSGPVMPSKIQNNYEIYRRILSFVIKCASGKEKMKSN